MHNAASTDPPSAASFPDDATSAEAPSERALYARTLGATTLRRTVDGELGPPLLEVGKPLALITYVAASPSRSTSRDALVELLWSDVDPEKGKHALRQTLWYIKKKVGESVLTSRDDAIALAAPLKDDRDELLRASELGDHARVVELHSGDFFPGFAAAGGAAFEQWADLERRRLRAFFFRSAENRTRQLLALGKSREAITLARRARDSDPGNQASWRLILETLTVARDTTSAELEAVALERLAERDDVELEPATRSLLRLTRHEATSADSAPTQSPSFVSEIVGREREFSILLERWAEVKRGKGRHVHLRAPAGIGKTRLLNDLHSRLRSARARVATVRCDMGSRELPYSGASDIAAALSALPGARGVSPSSAASLVALNPSLSSYFSPVADNSSGPEALRRRATALGELAAAVSEEAPLAILVDDVHWMDGASRTVISQLATRCASRRVLLVTTGRPIPEGQLEAPESETLELPSLTETQCAALLATFAELPNVSWGSTLASDLWRASSGSPLHAIETLQLLMERGVLTRDGVAWRCTDEEALRQTLRAGGALARRLGALSEPERAVVILLAASGAPLGQATVVHSTALPSDIADQAFHSLERRGFLARNDREWSLAHDEILAAVEEDTTSDAMQSAHGALGHCLWNENPTEVRELRRAAGHLVRGDGQDALGSLFFRFVRVMRSLSDVRPLHVLAADLLGRHTTAQLAKRLVRSLPLFVRIGLTSRPRRYAALLIVLLVPVTLFDVVMLVRIFASRVPDAEVVVFRTGTAGEIQGTTVPVYANDWTPSLPLVSPRATDVRLETESLAWLPVEIPGTRGRWIFSAITNDSGVIDVFESVGRKARRRLTFARGDDMLSGVSPDGSYALLVTGRWNADSHYDIGLLDLSTGSVSQLTSGDASDLGAQWSPDASRLAFVRRSWDDDGRRVCVIFPDGSELRCLDSLRSVNRILGWHDAESIVVEHEEGGAGVLSMMNVEGARGPPPPPRPA